jgi:hypothetical protein
MASVVVPRSAERLVLGAALALLVLLVLLVAVIGSLLQSRQGCGPGGRSGGSPTATAAAAIPKTLLPIYRAAERRYGVPWNVLAAINQVETDFGRNLNVSSAGAVGWMQFMPATWERYGVDADNDGHKDPDNPRDAIFAAANYLRASGAPHDMRGALWAYNHATWYVQQVLALAHSYAETDPDDATPGASVASMTPVARADCAIARTGPAELDRAVTLHGPRRFALLPAWAMAGRAPQPVDARILPDVVWILRTYGLRVTAARETGHLSHGDGTAVDMVPTAGNGQQAWDDSALRLARDIGWTPACGANGTAAACPLKAWVRFVGYNGYPNHGDPAHTGPIAHIHVSWSASASGAAVLSAPNDWVRVFPIPIAGRTSRARGEDR